MMRTAHTHRPPPYGTGFITIRHIVVATTSPAGFCPVTGACSNDVTIRLSSQTLTCRAAPRRTVASMSRPECHREPTSPRRPRAAAWPGMQRPCHILPEPDQPSCLQGSYVRRGPASASDPWWSVNALICTSGVHPARPLALIRHPNETERRARLTWTRTARQSQAALPAVT